MTTNQESAGALLTQALEAIPQALLIADIKLEVHLSNTAARATLAVRDGIGVSDGRLFGTTMEARARLRDLVSRAQSVSSSHAPVGVALPRPSGRHPYYLTAGVMRRRGAPDLLKLTIIDPSRDQQLDGRALRELFRLTNRETELAMALGRGLSPAEASELMSVSRETVRTHLRHLYQKTQTCRQADLVRLVLLASPA